MGDNLKETSRAALVSVTTGMANTMTRGRSLARVCNKCQRGVPAYPGRYPTRCPMCKGQLEAPVEEASVRKVPRSWSTSKKGRKEMNLWAGLARQNLVASAKPTEIRRVQQVYTFAHEAARAGVGWWEEAEKAAADLADWLKRHGHSIPTTRGGDWVAEGVVTYMHGQEPDPNAPVIATSSYAPTIQRLIEAGTKDGDGVRLPYTLIGEYIPGGVSGLDWYTEKAGDRRYRCESPTGPVLVFEFDAGKDEARAYLTDSPQRVLGFDPREEMVEDSGWDREGNWAKLDEASRYDTLAHYYGDLGSTIFKNKRYPWWFVPQSTLKNGGFKGLWVDWQGHRGRKPRKAINKTVSKFDAEEFVKVIPNAGNDIYAAVAERFKEKGVRLNEDRRVLSEVAKPRASAVSAVMRGIKRSRSDGESLTFRAIHRRSGIPAWNKRVAARALRWLVDTGFLDQQRNMYVVGPAGESLIDAPMDQIRTVVGESLEEGAAQTAWSQLRQMKINGFPLLAYLGAKNPTVDNDKLTVTLRGKWKGRVVIKLNKATDLYDLTFGRVRKYEWIVDAEVDGIDAASLPSVLQRYVEYGEAKKKRGRVRESQLDEVSWSAATAETPTPSVLKDADGTDEDRRASAFRPRKQAKGDITRVYGGTRFTVGSRKRKPRKNVEASIQNRLNARRGQAKRIEAAKKWHQSYKGRELHRNLGRFNTGNRRGESASADNAPFFATTTGAMLNIAESLLVEFTGTTEEKRLMQAIDVVKAGMRRSGQHSVGHHHALRALQDALVDLMHVQGIEEAFVNESQVVSMRDLAALERVLDQLFASAGIDIEFTRHFIDRVNDIRNRRQITVSELGMIFKEVFQRHAGKIKGRGTDWEAVIKDVTSAINIPFVLNYNRRSKMLELIAKTVMRKKDFKTRNKQLTVQTSATERAEAARQRIAELTEPLNESAQPDGWYAEMRHGSPMLYIPGDKWADKAKATLIAQSMGYKKVQYMSRLGAFVGMYPEISNRDVEMKLRRAGMLRESRFEKSVKKEPVSENFADAYPSNLPPLPAGMADENPSIDDLFDAVLRRLIVIEFTDVLEDANFDENGSIYLFFDPSLTHKEIDEVYRWIQQEQKTIQLIASPDKSLPDEVSEADWWVLFLPGSTLEEGEEVVPDPQRYAREDGQQVPPKQQIVVETPPTAPEALAQAVDTDKLVKAIGEQRVTRWLTAYPE